MAQAIFNPLTGNIDFIGISSGGGASGPAQRFSNTFNNTSDWSLNVSEYIITILASVHGKGVTPNVMVFEQNGSNYDEVFAGVSINASGDVVISVNSSPDNRFNGLYIII